MHSERKNKKEQLTLMNYIIVVIALIFLVFAIYKRWDSYTGKKPFDENDWWNDKGSDLD